MTADVVRFPGKPELLQDDVFPLKEAMTAIEKTRAPNKRIRKQLMLDALQQASVAIYREEPYLAKEKLADVLRLINSTWPDK